MMFGTYLWKTYDILDKIFKLVLVHLNHQFATDVL